MGNGAGSVLIYRGLAAGRMVVGSPLSAIVAAAVPLPVGMITGKRPGVLPLASVVTALPAIWLVSGPT